MTTPKRTHAKTAQSRSLIEDAGIKVLLRNPDAAMSEIALAAGVGRATLYRHFESRDVLIQADAVKCLEETDEVLAPLKAQEIKGKAAISATIDLLMPMASRFRFLMRLQSIAYENKTAVKIYKRQLGELSQLVHQAHDAGEFRRDLPVTWIVSSFDALLNNAWHLVQIGDMTPDEAASAFKKSFFSGCQS